MQVPKRGAGADRLIVVKKSGNADGAKGANHSAKRRGQPTREEPQRVGKSYEIAKVAVWEAYMRVKANRGAAGVDGQSLAAFEEDLKGNLYKVWNRMSSGSYFPAAVRLVEIPKQSGGKRPLGIPTVSDRIAQAVVKAHLERLVEPKFHPSSYGARPGRSAHDALEKTRQRCWRKDWVIDLDVQDFFGSLPHDLVMRAVRHHCSERWVHLYVERWLKAPIQDGTGVVRTPLQGTPQGGVISPLLRRLVLNGAAEEKDMLPDTSKLAYHINKIGNNINQLVKIAHQKNLRSPNSSLQSEIQKTNRLLNGSVASVQNKYNSLI